MKASLHMGENTIAWLLQSFWEMGVYYSLHVFMLYEDRGQV